MKSKSFFQLSLITCLIIVVSCMHQNYRRNGLQKYRIHSNYPLAMEPRHDLKKSYSAASYSDNYGEHGLTSYPSLLCTTYSTVTTTAVTTTTTNTVTNTQTTTTTDAATRTALFTSTLTATALSTTTVTTTVTAPAVTNTVMIPVTETTTTTVITLLPRTDCNNTGRKKRRAFVKFVEESSNDSVPGEELDAGPEPAAKVAVPEVLTSFAY